MNRKLQLLSLLGFVIIVGCNKEIATKDAPRPPAATHTGPHPVTLESTSNYPKNQLNDPKILSTFGRPNIAQQHKRYSNGTQSCLVATYTFASAPEAALAIKSAKQKSKKPEAFFLQQNQVLHISGDTAVVNAVKSQLNL